MKNIIWNTKYLFVILLVSYSCSQHNKLQKPLIIVSKDPKGHIQQWLERSDSNFVVKEFYSLPKDSMSIVLRQAKGIVMTGGEDVNPEIYGKPDYVIACDKPDNFRDSIEVILIKYALAKKIPIIGICRGCQIINACMGGTLIPDIPSYKKNAHNHRCEKDSAHFVIFEKDSWLKKEFGVDSICVNSHHHQAVDQVSGLFNLAAMSSPDHIIESIEIKPEQHHPFAIAVQWHPEALNDSISIKIGGLFLKRAREKANQH